MRNLKRALSMIMAVAMMMSLVVFSASATSFNDDKDIANKEAVDMATALKIINGLPDGSFNPTGNVTRAEMAKMICILLNGGNEPTVGAKTGNPTFNDIRGHWAEGYIEYCVAEGIIAGMGDGTFQPNGQVTGTQAAKMLLVALGYRAEAEGFNGANWAVKINVRATQKKLYDDITVASVNAALSRDNAAQMIWNALSATVVQYDYELITVNGQLQSVLTAKDVMIGATTDPLTLLADKYKQAEQIGTLTGYSWNEKDKMFVYTLTYGSPSTTATFKSATDYTDLFGLQVKAVYRTNKSDNLLFGMVTNKSSVLASGVISDMKIKDNFNESSFTLGGTKVNVVSTVGKVKDLPVYAQNVWTAGDVVSADIHDGSAYLMEGASNFNVKAVDADGDNRADYLVYLPFTVAQVNSVSSKNIGLTDGYGPDKSTRSIARDDNKIFDGVAVDDYVMMVNSANTAYKEMVVTKLDSFDGEAGALRSDEVRVDGTWYDKTHKAVADVNKVGDKYTFYKVGGVVYFADLVEGVSLKDVVFIAEAGPTGIGGEAKVYFAVDGTSKVVSLDSDLSKHTGYGSFIGMKDSLATFKEKNGTYTLKKIDGNNLAGMDGYVGQFEAGFVEATISAPTNNNNNGKFVVDATTGSSTTFADDAVVFVKHSTSKVEILTGKQAKSLTTASAGATGGNGDALYDTVKGLNTIKVAFVESTSKPVSVDTSDNYAYILGTWTGADPTDKDNDVLFLELWTGSEVKEVYFDDTSSAARNALVDGAVITYTKLSDKEIDVVYTGMTANNRGLLDGTGAIDATGKVVAITGANQYAITVAVGAAPGNGDAPATGASTGTAATYDITKDTVFMYVDSKDSKYQETGTNNLAVKTFNTTGANDVHAGYHNNALILVNSDGEILLLVVENVKDDYILAP